MLDRGSWSVDLREGELCGPDWETRNDGLRRVAWGVEWEGGLVGKMAKGERSGVRGSIPERMDCCLPCSKGFLS